MMTGMIGAAGWNLPTLPRGLHGWNERRGLLASGPRPPSRFPSGVKDEVLVPVTVAGPRRNCTGFRVLCSVLQLWRESSAVAVAPQARARALP
jgi:hypothetical protein